MPGTLAVLTMTRAHHDALLGQVDGLSVGSVPPDLHVVISMGDRDLTRGRLPLGTDRWRTVVRPVPTDRRALPYAAARNLAAEIAIEEGAQILVFLGGGVLPGPRTLERYVTAATEGAAAAGTSGPVVWSGPMLDLPPVENPAVGYPLRTLHELGRRTPGAPDLAPGQYRRDDRWHLFSPDVFAMSAEDFTAVGGFCPDYTGPGLEAFDFGTVVSGHGGSLVWVGGTEVYRQPEDRLSPEQEVKHALAHTKVWRERWGAEPGSPWLTRLVGEGLLRQDRSGRIAAS
ncbi:hypothetical protein [Serinicoccus sp. LYQ131]|uniref:hypothetical protein n=1 Tax=Serinicoccus sp. LYQ131 TaxID=3378797 RepID=UPI0038535F0E